MDTWENLNVNVEEEEDKEEDKEKNRREETKLRQANLDLGLVGLKDVNPPDVNDPHDAFAVNLHGLHKPQGRHVVSCVEVQEGKDNKKEKMKSKREKGKGR